MGKSENLGEKSVSGLILFEFHDRRLNGFYSYWGARPEGKQYRIVAEATNKRRRVIQGDYNCSFYSLVDGPKRHEDAKLQIVKLGIDSYELTWSRNNKVFCKGQGFGLMAASLSVYFTGALK